MVIEIIKIIIKIVTFVIFCLLSSYVLLFGKEKSDKLYNEMINDGWIYLEGIVPIIKDEYLKNRNKYKTQDEIMELVINYLEKEKEKCVK